MIRILKDYGIMGKRNEKKRGVWFGKDKAGFVEIAVRSGDSLHSFTLNVNADLSFFELVQPYSLNRVRVTSMNAILGNRIPLEEVKERAIVHFSGGLQYLYAKNDITCTKSSEFSYGLRPVPWPLLP